MENLRHNALRGAFSPAEVGVILGVSERTIHRWIADGLVRSFLIARRRRISREELDRLMYGKQDAAGTQPRHG